MKSEISPIEGLEAHANSKATQKGHLDQRGYQKYNICMGGSLNIAGIN